MSRGPETEQSGVVVPGVETVRGDRRQGSARVSVTALEVLRGRRPLSAIC